MSAVLLFRAEVQMLDATLDPATTDWVYRCDTLTSPTPTEAADVSNAINHFYNVVATGSTLAYCSYLNTSVQGSGGLTWTAYDITAHLNGSNHGAPIASNAYGLSGPGIGSGTIPEGVAASLSFRRDYGTDVEFVRDPTTGKVTSRPRGQDRGRMYLGPLDGGCFVKDSTTKRTKLTNTFMTDMCNQLQHSLTINDSGSNVWHFSQWSRKKASVADLALIWMDDRPDYQRRRTDQSMTKYSIIPSY